MISEAAIQIGGKTYKGRSHGDIILRLPHNIDIDTRIEGFVTDSGLFLDRRKAYDHAAKCGQVKPGRGVLASWMLTANAGGDAHGNR